MNFFDTSIFVAAAQTTHQKQVSCLQILRNAIPSTAACSLHTLAETYAVLTAMPAPHGVPPSIALDMIDHIRRHVRVVALSEKEYVAAIESVAGFGLRSGIIYDALHMACARKVGATRIYTLNPKHFKLVAPDIAALVREP